MTGRERERMRWVGRERPRTERIACPLEPDGKRLLEFALPVHDALFAWCRQSVVASA